MKILLLTIFLLCEATGAPVDDPDTTKEREDLNNLLDSDLSLSENQIPSLTEHRFDFDSNLPNDLDKSNTDEFSLDQDNNLPIKVQHTAEQIEELKAALQAFRSQVGPVVVEDEQQNEEKKDQSRITTSVDDNQTEEENIPTLFGVDIPTGMGQEIQIVTNEKQDENKSKGSFLENNYYNVLTATAKPVDIGNDLFEKITGYLPAEASTESSKGSEFDATNNQLDMFNFNGHKPFGIKPITIEPMMSVSNNGNEPSAMPAKGYDYMKPLKTTNKFEYNPYNYYYGYTRNKYYNKPPYTFSSNVGFHDYNIPTNSIPGYSDYGSDYDVPSHIIPDYVDTDYHSSPINMLHRPAHVPTNSMTGYFDHSSDYDIPSYNTPNYVNPEYHTSPINMLHRPVHVPTNNIPGYSDHSSDYDNPSYNSPDYVDPDYHSSPINPLHRPANYYYNEPQMDYPGQDYYNPPQIASDYDYVDNSHPYYYNNPSNYGESYGPYSSQMPPAPEYSTPYEGGYYAGYGPMQNSETFYKDPEYNTFGPPPQEEPYRTPHKYRFWSDLINILNSYLANSQKQNNLKITSYRGVDVKHNGVSRTESNPPTYYNYNDGVNRYAPNFYDRDYPRIQRYAPNFSDRDYPKSHYY